jgi:hypothetical protein
MTTTTTVNDNITESNSNSNNNNNNNNNNITRQIKEQEERDFYDNSKLERKGLML